MRLIVAGVLTDFRGRVLLRQTGAKSLAPVRRALEPGSLPADTLARAFREETGLIVMPIRLVGLQYDAGRPGGELVFWFRCTMRGGDLKIPPGDQPAGFFDLPLPAALPAPDRQQIDMALHHAGDRPVMEETPAGLGARIGRRFGRRETGDEADSWRVEAGVVSQANDTPIEWLVADPDTVDSTPAEHSRPPWVTAEHLLNRTLARRVSAVRLARVEMAPDRPAIALVFAPLSSSIDPSQEGRNDNDPGTPAL